MPCAIRILNHWVISSRNVQKQLKAGTLDNKNQLAQAIPVSLKLSWNHYERVIYTV